MLLDYAEPDCKRIVYGPGCADIRVRKTGKLYQEFVDGFSGKDIVMGYVRHEENSMFVQLITEQVSAVAGLTGAMYLPHCSMNVSLNASSEFSSDYIIQELAPDSDRLSKRSHSTNGSSERIFISHNSFRAGHEEASILASEPSHQKSSSDVGPQSPEKAPAKASRVTVMAASMNLDDLMSLRSPGLAAQAVNAARFTTLASSHDLQDLMTEPEPHNPADRTRFTVLASSHSALQDLLNLSPTPPPVPSLKDSVSSKSRNTVHSTEEPESLKKIAHPKPEADAVLDRLDRSPKDSSKRTSGFWKGIKMSIENSTFASTKQKAKSANDLREEPSDGAATTAKKVEEFWVGMKNQLAGKQTERQPAPHLMPKKAHQLLMGGGDYKKKAASLNNLVIPKRNPSAAHEGGAIKILVSPSSSTSSQRIPHPLSASPITASPDRPEVPEKDYSHFRPVASTSDAQPRSVAHHKQTSNISTISIPKEDRDHAALSLSLAKLLQSDKDSHPKDDARDPGKKRFHQQELPKVPSPQSNSQVELKVLHKGMPDRVSQQRLLQISKGFFTVLENESSIMPLYDIPYEKVISFQSTMLDGIQTVTLVISNGNHTFTSTEKGLDLKELMLQNKRERS
ncbi:hypothetical protein HDU91_000967 [Kappamyces sp. JEL0680]|nr:hypothetical protein HDU91_000967 [Kappamyces sp. JEL0680]